MPKLTHHQETAIRRAIRDAFAIDPLIDGRTLLKYLDEKFKHSFSLQYVQKLVNKVGKEATPRLDKIKVENELRHIGETIRINIETLTRIALGQVVGDRPIPTYMEMTAASRTIGVLKKLQLDAMIDLGVFDKAMIPSIGPRSREIPAELMDSMVESAKLWELPSDLNAKIDAGGTVTVESKDMPPKVETQNVAVKTEEKQPQENAITIPAHNGIEAVPEFRIS